MKRVLLSIMLLVAVLLVSSSVALAAPGKPNFTPQVWGDGMEWGTKGTAEIKGPNGHNNQSFNKLFVVIYDGAPTQLPVADAAPGNPDYTPRWWTHTAEWNEDGVIAHGIPLPTLTFYEPGVIDPANLWLHEDLGHIDIVEGSPGPPPPDYFVCPLLPVKD